MQITQFLRQAITLNPNRIATICGDRQRTWSDLASRIPRVAAALHGLSVSDGAYVAVLAMNSDRYVELFYAVPWAGGCFAPMNVRWSAAENAHALRDCGAVVLCVDDAFADQGAALAAMFPGMSLIHIGDSATPEGMLRYETLAADTAPMPDAGRGGSDSYAVFYTGGTTGLPKGVAFSHQALCQASVAYLAMLPETEDLSFAYVGGFFHFSAANAALYITLAGGTHVVLPKFDPVLMMQAIAAHRVTNAVMVPTMVTIMLNHPEFDRYDLTSLRTLVYGGSPMPEQLMAEATARLPGWRFWQIYGMTETGGFATMLRWREHRFDGPTAHRIRSCGQPAPGVEVRIVGADGHEVPRGAMGEIVMRSDYQMSGYLNQPAQTAATLRDGWVFSGDAGRMDAHGYLYVEDRVKDMIVTGGENVFSVEVERALFSHPAVMQAAVIGIPSEAWGEAVHAIVVPRPGAAVTEADLIAHCRRLIGGYKCPKSITFQPDPLPVGPGGKVKKAALRAPFWIGQERRI
ncbi:MAG: AMP-binding protein [Gemmobacter sp.]|nr:AMP-binding protein [Gemmobacter sp.]